MTPSREVAVPHADVLKATFQHASRLHSVSFVPLVSARSIMRGTLAGDRY
jgi:hypothetical protein